MKRWQVWVGILLLVILTIALAAWVVAARGTFVRERIVMPLSYAIWISSLLLRGTPQVLFWGILLLITVVLALRSLIVPGRPPQAIQANDSAYYHRPRLRHWVRQIVLSRNERYKRYLMEGMAKLSLDVLGYQQGLTSHQYQQLIDAGKQQAPDILVPYLQARDNRPFSSVSPNGPRVRRWLERLPVNLPFFPKARLVQDPELEELVAYLEEQLDLE